MQGGYSVDNQNVYNDGCGYRMMEGYDEDDGEHEGGTQGGTQGGEDILGQRYHGDFGADMFGNDTFERDMAEDSSNTDEENRWETPKGHPLIM